MIISIFAYFITFIVTVSVLKNKKIKYKPFPNLRICKNGIIFYSYMRHRLYIGDAKLLIIKNNIYLKRKKSLIILCNVEYNLIQNKFLYFSCFGETRITFNANDFYRYFNIFIKSSKFNFKKLKQITLKSILNNLFNLEDCKLLKRYLNFIKNILRIEIDKERICVSKNLYNLSYELIYKINNTVKHLKVKETI